MSTEIIDWPSVLKPSEATFWETDQTISGTRGASGRESLVQSDAGFWKAEVTFSVFRPGHKRALEGFLALVNGRYNIVRLPVFDCTREPFYVSTGQHLTGVPHAGGAPFSDGAFYRTEPIDAFVSSGAAGSLIFFMRVNSPPSTLFFEPGQLFSIESRLNRVRKAVKLSPTLWRIETTIPLRVTGTARVVWSHPAGLFRFAPEFNARDARFLTMMKTGTITLPFEEAF
jgi:hypothetical protein